MRTTRLHPVPLTLSQSANSHTSNLAAAARAIHPVTYRDATCNLLTILVAELPIGTHSQWPVMIICIAQQWSVNGCSITYSELTARTRLLQPRSTGNTASDTVDWSIHLRTQPWVGWFLCRPTITRQLHVLYIHRDSDLLPRLRRACPITFARTTERA